VKKTTLSATRRNNTKHKQDRTDERGNQKNTQDRNNAEQKQRGTKTTLGGMGEVARYWVKCTDYNGPITFGTSSSLPPTPSIARRSSGDPPILLRQVTVLRAALVK
jgi:hypothetical protein